MYVIRDGPVHRHASQFRRGKLPRPLFICCGSVGVIMTIAGGIILGVGQKKTKSVTRDYSFVLIGSIVLGFGFIMTILAVFLSISWSSLTNSEYAATRRSSSSHSAVRDLDDLEMNGYRLSVSK